MARLLALLSLSLFAPLTWAATAAHVPNAPVLTATINGSNVVLTWVAPTTNTDGSTIASAGYTFKSYFVYRGTTAALVAGSSHYAGNSPNAITALTYTDAGAAAGAYYYAITAWYCDSAGCSESALSNVMQASAPVAVTGTVTVTWANPTTNVDGSALTDLTSINLYRGASCTALSLVNSVTAPATTYSDAGLAPGPYCYALTAVSKSEGEGPASPAISVTLSNPVPTTKPAAPGSATAVCTVMAPTGVKVTCTVTP